MIMFNPPNPPMFANVCHGRMDFVRPPPPAPYRAGGWTKRSSGLRVRALSARAVWRIKGHRVVDSIPRSPLVHRPRPQVFAPRSDPSRCQARQLQKSGYTDPSLGGCPDSGPKVLKTGIEDRESLRRRSLSLGFCSAAPGFSCEEHGPRNEDCRAFDSILGDSRPRCPAKLGPWSEDHQIKNRGPRAKGDRLRIRFFRRSPVLGTCHDDPWFLALVPAMRDPAVRRSSERRSPDQGTRSKGDRLQTRFPRRSPSSRAPVPAMLVAWSAERGSRGDGLRICFARRSQVLGACSGDLWFLPLAPAPPGSCPLFRRSSVLGTCSGDPRSSALVPAIPGPRRLFRRSQVLGACSGDPRSSALVPAIPGSWPLFRRFEASVPRSADHQIRDQGPRATDSGLVPSDDPRRLGNLDGKSGCRNPPAPIRFAGSSR